MNRQRVGSADAVSAATYSRGETDAAETTVPIITKWRKMKELYPNKHNGTFDYIEYIDEKMRPIEIPPNPAGKRVTLCCRANMKMGKTKMTQAFLTTHDAQFKRVLTLTCRRSFAAELKNKFPTFACYLDEKKGTMIDKAKVILQVDSLWRYDRSRGPPDLLLLDELESLIEQVCSSQANRRDFLETFFWLMRYTPVVIALDANLGERGFELLRTYRPDETSMMIVYANLFQNQEFDLDGRRNQFLYTRSPKATMCAFVRALKEKKKIVVPCNTVRRAKIAYETAVFILGSNEKVILYEGDTDDKIKSAHFANVKEYWIKYDVVIYTPTITAGCSFEMRHFHQLFAFLTDKTTSVETTRQMLYRVRQLIDNKYTVCFVGCRERSDSEDMDEFWQQRADDATEAPRLRQDWLARSLTEDGRHFNITKDDYYWAYYYNIQNRIRSRNDFVNLFLAQEEATGARYEQLKVSKRGDLDDILERAGINLAEIEEAADKSRYEGVVKAPEVIIATQVIIIIL